VANTNSAGQQQGYEKMERGSSKQFNSNGIQSGKNDVADSKREGLQRSEQYETHTRETSTQFPTAEQIEATGLHWAIEPDVGRVAHGIPNRMDRLKSLGNSLVPQIPFLIANCIKQIEGV